MYRSKDIQTLLNHNGDAHILWHDNDCNPYYESRVKNVGVIIDRQIKEHLCYNKKTSAYLDELNIQHITINLGQNTEEGIDNTYVSDVDVVQNKEISGYYELDEFGENESEENGIEYIMEDEEDESEEFKFELDKLLLEKSEQNETVDNNSEEYNDNESNEESNEQIKIIKVNDVFDKVYVISLKKDVNKKHCMSNKLGSLGIKFEFFEAIDGSIEPYITSYNAYKKLPYDSPGSHFYELSRRMKAIRSPGAYGYLLTWQKLLTYCVKSSYKNILVFDDDAIFDTNFNTKFNIFMDNISGNWKIITLGVSQHIWKNVNIKNHYYNTPVYTDGSFAIGINYSVYDLLLKETNKLNCAFDSGPIRSIYAKYHDNCFTSYPNIVIADVSVSSIGGSRNMIEFAKKAKWNLSNFNYNNCNTNPISDVPLNFVTIIIPMYNAENTIEICLQSLVDQTYDNMEIIVVNDFSTDLSETKVNIFTNKYKNIKLIHLEKNSGCYTARNVGIKHAKGQYIGFQDADDISLPTRIEKQVKALTEKNIIMCGCNFFRAKQEFTLDNIEANIVNQQKTYDECRSRFGLITLMFDREIFDKYGLYREDYRHSMDAEFVERIYYKLYKKICKVNIHTLLCTNNSENYKFYHKTNELLYVSTPMTKKNISSIFKQSTKDAVRRQVIKDLIKNKVKY